MTPVEVEGGAALAVEVAADVGGLAGKVILEELGVVELALLVALAVTPTAVDGMLVAAEVSEALVAETLPLFLARRPPRPRPLPLPAFTFTLERYISELYSNCKSENGLEWR